MERQEAEAVAALWRDYLSATFGAPGRMTPEVFLRDGMGHAFETMVARDGAGAPVAAAAWWMTYDAHHGVRGGEIPDMFVAPSHRKLGVAIQVISAVARSVRDRGGVFLRAPARLENAQRLTGRARVDGAFPVVHVYWGKALLGALADNAGADARTLARCLAAVRAAPPAG
jgi:GNAT superfamily N-acetyltransferase